MFSLYKTLRRLAVLSAHPVGEIYITTDNSFNPQSTWGGVWEKITDKFLVGAGNSYSIGATGGEATHALILDEIPSHNHNFNWASASRQYSATAHNETNNWNFATSDEGNSVMVNWTNSQYKRQGLVGSKGGSQPHNNLPPYLAVNIWKRTA